MVMVVVVVMVMVLAIPFAESICRDSYGVTK
jgi:hypothetical protein